jgi:quinoprotein glucose dehydrogenase
LAHKTIRVMALLDRVISVLICLLGIMLAGGGAYLLTLGGSAYYLLAGIALLVAGVQIWRRRGSGYLLYIAVCLVTLFWALFEVGLNGWSLLPRLDLIFGLGLALLIVHAAGSESVRLRRGTTALVTALVIVFVGSLWLARGPARTDATADPLANMASTDWVGIGNDAGNQRFSQLGQITPENVSGLKVAWTAHLAPSGPITGILEGTPIKVGNMLYMCDMSSRVHALDPDTGKSLWIAAPHLRDGAKGGGFCRGVTYARIDGMAPAEHCAERIVLATSSAEMFAFDAKDGKACLDFGNRGGVSTLEGLSPAPAGYYLHSSPPVLVHGKLVLGANSLDGQSVLEPSGVIRAYDARTGALAWAWDMGHPERAGMPPAGQYYTPGTPNSWTPLAADDKNGLVFIPTGNATPDYVMSHRTPVMNKYSSSLVALDADTGKLRWSFQTTHVDQWDYDVASPPTLIDYPAPNGGTIPAVAQATKRGQTFVLDRLTGKPLVAVTERKVPTDGVKGETFSPTQPYSGLPSMFGEGLSERTMWGMTPLDQLWCRIKFKEARYDGEFTPIMSARPSIIYPSYIGGSNWGGIAYDPVRQLLAVNVNHFPMYNRLIPRAEADRMGIKPYEPGKHELDIVNWAQLGTPWATPCSAPPYGVLGMIDLKTGKFAWSQPLGKATDTGPFGLSTYLPYTIGTPQLGGALLTAPGLTFIGATQERTFRAIDTANGKILWEDRLAAGAHANPMTYYSAKSGRQFVVVAASGHFQFDDGRSDLLIAYALPRSPNT